MRITRKDAALLLGVTPQTVTNLARRGALTMIQCGQFQYFNQDEVLSLVPKCGTIRNVEEAIAAVEKDLQSGLGRAVNEHRANLARKKFVESIAGGGRTLHNFTDAAMGLLKALMACSEAKERLSDREMDIVRDSLSFVPITETATYYRLTPERIRQIRNRAIRRVIHFSRDAPLEYEKMRKERDEARIKVKQLSEKNHAIHLENKRLKQVAGIPLDPDSFNLDFLKRDIRDLYFSVRLTNHLKAASIDTVGDLLSHSRESIARIRNLGRKSLIELDRWIDRNGLHYEMKINYGKED